MNTQKIQLIKQLYSNKFTNYKQNQPKCISSLRNYHYYNNNHPYHNQITVHRKQEKNQYQNPLEKVIKLQRIIKRQTSLPYQSNFVYPLKNTVNNYNTISFYINNQNNQQQSYKQKQIPTFYYVHQIKNDHFLFNNSNTKKNTLNLVSNNVKNKNYESFQNSSIQKKSKIFHIMEIFRQKSKKKSIDGPQKNILYSKKSLDLNTESKLSRKTTLTIDDCYVGKKESKQMKRQNNQNNLSLQIRKRIQSQKQQRVKKVHIKQKCKHSRSKNDNYSIRNQINKQEKRNYDENDLNPWIVVDNQF